MAKAPENNTGNQQAYAPPRGPPPPAVPKGWVAQYDPTYQRFYYVNLDTRRSQWEKPPATVDAATEGAASNEGSSTHAPQPMLVSQISPPKEIATPHMDSCNRQMAGKEQRKKTGFASQISSFFNHGSSRSELRQQDRPTLYYSSPIVHSQAAYMPQQSSSGIGTVGSVALGVGGGLLAGIALENAISAHDDKRYEQGFEDGADYVRRNSSGTLEQLGDESIQGEGMDPEGFDEGS